MELLREDLGDYSNKKDDAKNRGPDRVAKIHRHGNRVAASLP